jgi:hypothetical protein
MFWQPKPVSQLSAVHWLASSQSGGAPPAQTPVMQESAVVQASLSSQAAPSGTGLFWQPETALHVSTVQTFPS